MCQFTSGRLYSGYCPFLANSQSTQEYLHLSPIVGYQGISTGHRVVILSSMRKVMRERGRELVNDSPFMVELIQAVNRDMTNGVCLLYT